MLKTEVQNEFINQSNSVTEIRQNQMQLKIRPSKQEVHFHIRPSRHQIQSIQFNQSPRLQGQFNLIQIYRYQEKFKTTGSIH